jgi:hypothetical protein
MEKLQILISIAGTVASLLVTSIVFIIKFIQAVKSKKKIINNSLLEDAIAPLMEIAEKFKNYSGEEKKEYVLTKINQFALDNNLEFDESALSIKIEELIDLTKQVNYKKAEING